uniref:Uncharacterized protein n=1 Tax=uncultured bacterium contig00029 TaxID=1181518 RepID=A0A806JYN4_9BACT|nr:hypothetical protein [uncultured bacterium contig00029]
MATLCGNLSLGIISAKALPSAPSPCIQITEASGLSAVCFITESSIMGNIAILLFLSFKNDIHN